MAWVELAPCMDAHQGALDAQKQQQLVQNMDQMLQESLDLVVCENYLEEASEIRPERQ